MLIDKNDYICKCRSYTIKEPNYDMCIDCNKILPIWECQCDRPSGASHGYLNGPMICNDCNKVDCFMTIAQICRRNKLSAMPEVL
jgi:hypothetical protein